MIQLIALIIFLVSVAGVVVMLGKKVPVLVRLPQNGHHGLKKPEAISRLQKKIKEHHFHLFEKQMLLHTLLSKFRVWIMKMERYIGGLLMNIRKRAQELDREVKKKR